MKKISTFILTVSMAISSIASDVEKVDVNTTDSKMTWNGYKVTGSHTGNVAIKEGYLEFDENELVGGMFSIDMTTITTTDLEGEWADKLVGHLKSDDFFSVESHPTAELLITNVASRGETGEYKVVADLTIKGITNAVKFDVTINQEKGTAFAELEIDRTDFDVRYGSGAFFDNLGDKTIYDEFDLTINLMF